MNKIIACVCLGGGGDGSLWDRRATSSVKLIKPMCTIRERKRVSRSLGLCSLKDERAREPSSHEQLPTFFADACVNFKLRSRAPAALPTARQELLNEICKFLCLPYRQAVCVVFSALVVSDSTNKIKNHHSPSRMKIFMYLLGWCEKVLGLYNTQDFNWYRPF
jgi:hypothetical protein